MSPSPFQERAPFAVVCSTDWGWQAVGEEFLSPPRWTHRNLCAASHAYAISPCPARAGALFTQARTQISWHIQVAPGMPIVCTHTETCTRVLPHRRTHAQPAPTLELREQTGCLAPGCHRIIPSSTVLSPAHPSGRPKLAKPRSQPPSPWCSEPEMHPSESDKCSGRRTSWRQNKRGEQQNGPTFKGVHPLLQAGSPFHGEPSLLPASPPSTALHVATATASLSNPGLE